MITVPTIEIANKSKAVQTAENDAAFPPPPLLAILAAETQATIKATKTKT